MLFGIFNLVFCPAVCLFAFAKGRSAERFAAAIILTNFLLGTANFAFLHSQLVDLCIDAATAFALLPLTMRYASFWLGVVMLVYSLQFGLDAYYIVLERPLDELHSVVNNVDSILINLALAVGAATAWLRRRRAVTAVEGLSATVA